RRSSRGTRGAAGRPTWRARRWAQRTPAPAEWMRLRRAVPVRRCRDGRAAGGRAPGRGGDGEGGWVAKGGGGGADEPLVAKTKPPLSMTRQNIATPSAG